MGVGKSEMGAGTCGPVGDELRRDIKGAVALNCLSVNSDTESLTAWKVELRKHVFCSLTIPMGLRAVGSPREGITEGRREDGAELLPPLSTCCMVLFTWPSGLSDGIDIDGRGVIDGEVAMVSFTDVASRVEAMIDQINNDQEVERWSKKWNGGWDGGIS